MKFQSTKRFGPISTSHRQWRHKGHCSYVHGYGRYVEITFGAAELDDKGWVMDFGGLRDVREWINGQWDHRTLIAEDDPLLPMLKELEKAGGINLNVLPLPYGPGIELSAKYVFDKVNEIAAIGSGGRVWVESVRVWEHENNSAIYSREHVVI